MKHVSDAQLRANLTQPRNGWRGQERTQPTSADIAYARILRSDPCAYCGGPGGAIEHVDHAEHGWQNLTAACRRCNIGKGQHTLLRYLLAKSLREQRTDLTEQIRALGESNGPRSNSTRHAFIRQQVD